MTFNFKAVLFECYWYDNNNKVNYELYGQVDAACKSRISLNAPFVLAQPAQQVYYNKCLSKKRKDWCVFF